MDFKIEQAKLQVLQIAPYTYLKSLTNNPNPFIVLYKIYYIIQKCSLNTIIQYAKYITQIVNYHIKKLYVIQKYNLIEFMKLFTVLDLIKKKICMKMGNYDCNKFVWIVALLENIGIFIQKNNSIMQKQQNQVKIKSSNQEKIKIIAQVEFLQCNFLGTIISQMCLMAQNNNQGERINEDFTVIVKNQDKLPSSHCLGCWNYKIFSYFNNNNGILAVKERQNFPITEQFFLVIGLLKNPTFIQQIMDGICAVLNAGGGYLILNSSTEKKVQGISFQKQFQLKDDCIRAILNASRLIRPSSQNAQLFKILPQIIYTLDNPIYHMLQQFQQSLQLANYLKTILRKFIIIVTILPKIPISSSKIYHPTLFYQQQKIKSNKFAYPTFIYQGNTIKKIEQQYVYNFLTKYAKKNARSNFGCLGCAQMMDKNIKQQLQKIQSKEEQQSDLPNVTRYKNCTVIVITSLKYQQEVSQKIKNLLVQKKLSHSFKKPYNKYTSTSLRPIWYINHTMEFKQLNNLINTKIDHSLYRAIVVTNFLKLRGYPDSQKLSRMKNIICTAFNIPEPQFKTKYLTTGNKMNKKQLHYFYKFLDFQHSILAFIYLDGVSVKSEFVKQAQFVN